MEDYVALYGGAFDPFHHGHQYILDELKVLGFKKIILLPTGNSVFNKKLTPSNHRIHMINLAVIGVEISNYEILSMDNPSYTIDSIDHFLKEYPKICFVMGEDSFYQFKKWKDWQQILNKTKILVINRGSNSKNFFNFIRSEKFTIENDFKKFITSANQHIYYHQGLGYNTSSSEIKMYLQNRELADCRKHLNKKILDYILEFNLYGVD